MRETIVDVVAGIVPITLLISLLHFTIARMPETLFLDFLGGALLVTLGLILFLLGVNLGLVDTGGAIGSTLASTGKLRLILLFGFVIGFAVTVPEPDVQALSLQVRNVSQGGIDDRLLVLIIALGVGIFTAFALLRMFLKVPIYYILVAGYALAMILLLFCPPKYASIAFDAGGVTTGSLTVPFILALGLGVAAVVPGRHRTSNSFGILGLASLGPVLAVLILGVFRG